MKSFLFCTPPTPPQPSLRSGVPLGTVPAWGAQRWGPQGPAHVKVTTVWVQRPNTSPHHPGRTSCNLPIAVVWDVPGDVKEEVRLERDPEGELG